MILEMQSAESSDLLDIARWDVGIVGGSLDDRGRASVEFMSKGARTHLVAFRPGLNNVALDERTIQVEEFEDFVGALFPQRILLDATTLSVVEIFICCRAIAVRGGKIGLIYTEPARYFRRRRMQLVHRRDFSLSEEVQPFSAVPGAAVLIGERGATRAVFLLGYEGERLDQAIEQTGLGPNRCHVVLGVPAFRPGWEMDSFANNMRVMRQRGLGAGNVLFAGAQNPAAALGVIEKVHESCTGTQRLLICPIGTKPHGIAAALYAATHSGVGMIFDHPKRRLGRSEQVARWHYFNVAFPPTDNRV